MDDILIMSSDERATHEVKHYLDSLFTIKDLGLAKYFLGVEVDQTQKGTFVS